MADLGSIGSEIYGPSFNERCNFDIISGKDVSLYPVRAVGDVFSQTTIPFTDRKFFRGTVKNAAGSGIQRNVLCVDQVSLVVVDTTVSATDGTFTVRPLTNNPVAVFFIPEGGDAKNGVILTDLTPVDA